MDYIVKNIIKGNVCRLELEFQECFGGVRCWGEE